ncbi:MAG: TonB-dependent receptor, partial [Gammaproteobacteria bacterium]|nr:TonB-dependent receptor [Gammaproteobacteria bacterium]
MRTWQPIPWLGQTSFNPLNVGNKDLGPERTIELEAGIDGVFMDERLRIGFTYYDQETRDALIPVQLVPSLGFTGSQ